MGKRSELSACACVWCACRPQTTAAADRAVTRIRAGAPRTEDAGARRSKNKVGYRQVLIAKFYLWWPRFDLALGRYKTLSKMLGLI